MYVASFTGGKATSNLYKQADLSSQFTSPAHLLPEVLTSGESTTLASIHHVPSPEVARSCEGHTTKAPWCVRHPVCVLAPVEPFHSHSHCLLPPPLFPAFPVALCVCVLARPWQRNLCLHRVLAVRPQIYLGESLPASRRMKSSRGAPNQKEIIFACQSTQYCTRKKRKSGQTTAEIR